MVQIYPNQVLVGLHLIDAPINFFAETKYFWGIVGITNVSGDGGSGNDSYIKKAVNGTKSAKGVVEQILEKGILEADDRVDAVTHATCSSDAIIEGCKAALEAAKRPAETEAE